MAYSINNKTGEIKISGFEKGVATSPHEGIANIQNANIYTETGEVMNSFARVQQSQGVINGVTSTGTLTQVATDAVSATITGGAAPNLLTGSWILVSGSTISGLANGAYYVLDGSPNSIGYELSVTYSTTSVTKVTGMTAGTASFTTVDMGKPIASCIENYTDSNGVFQNRYYVLDLNGRVWVHDTSTAQYTNISFPPTWFLPYYLINWVVGTPSGIEVLNGWLFIFTGNSIWTKSTVRLGDAPGNFIIGTGPLQAAACLSSNPHFAFTGHQGDLYYTDGQYVASIFPSTSLVTGLPNIQSYCSYTVASAPNQGQTSTIISGSFPSAATSAARIPAVFFSEKSGTPPTALTADTVFWIDSSAAAGSGYGSMTFEVFAAATGGSAKDISTGATGKQYFNTFYPASLGGSVGGGSVLQVFTPQRLNLPTFEISQSIIEIGNTVIIGTQGNVLYPWNQIDPTPSDLIFLPESNTVNMICVNNMAYVFAGNKGNIYITNGSSASPAISVPDYCAGIAGTPASYIEPYFSWGDAMYLRGRVYFSILDQTAAKTGNCGGIWSFVPTQNFFIGQDVGLSLRLENQNSYGTYNGLATVLLPAQNQNAQSPQYWSAWYSNITAPLYGIDFTDTAVRTGSPAIIETDLIPTGTMLDKKTFSQIEFKVSTPIVDSGTVAISYRTNATAAYTSLANLAITETNPLSGYYTANFEKTQWLQLKVTLTPNPATIRLTEIIIR